MLMRYFLKLVTVTSNCLKKVTVTCCFYEIMFLILANNKSIKRDREVIEDKANILHAVFKLFTSSLKYEYQFCNFFC